MVSQGRDLILDNNVETGNQISSQEGSMRKMINKTRVWQSSFKFGVIIKCLY